jgi:hypothetical protein
MSFLQDYTILTATNEAPTIYHRWCALSLLSHSVGRQVWIDWSIVGKVHLNLYIILVGNPGSKKSTAMRIARGFIERLKVKKIAADSMTREMICLTMGQEDSKCQQTFTYEDKKIRYSQLSIFANELINLINSGGNAIGMIDFFTDVWDKELYEVETKGKGCDVIERPYVSILGCLTPSTIKLLLSQRVVSGGMVRRCIFVQAQSSSMPVAFPEMSEEQVAASTRIFAHIQKVRNAVGPMVWTDEAREVFKSFYDDNFWRKKKVHDEALASFLETKPELVLKVAALRHMAQDPIEYKLTADSIHFAVAMVTEVEQGGSYLFAGVGTNKMSSVAQAMEQLINANADPVHKKFLYQAFIKDATIPEIDEIIEGFQRTDKFVVAEVTRGKHQVPVTYISTKEKMDAFHERLRAASKDSQQSSGPPS